MRDYLLVYINGKEHRLGGLDAFKTVSNFLRLDKRLTGTKIVCEEGDCGACSVMIGRVANGRMTYKPINSCIQFLYQLDCAHIVTIEGLSVNGTLNSVQEEMVNCHGAQCGYCTPGFVVSMCALLEEKDHLNEQDIRDALIGNLCRCTGYQPIIKAGLEVDVASLVKLAKLYPAAAMVAELEAHKDVSVLIEANSKKYFGPTELSQAIAFKSNNLNTVIVAGATDIGVNYTKRDVDPQVLMSLTNIRELKELKIDNDVLEVGANTSLAHLEEFVKDKIPELSKILWLFGGPGIKHVGTLAGNIANGSPIADTLPFLYVTNAQVELISTKGIRLVKVDSLYKGYKKLNIADDEIIARVLIPIPTPVETLKLYKVSRRSNLDISAFTAAFLMRRKGDIIESIAIAYGGVAPVVLRLPKTERFLTGKKYTSDVFEAAGSIALEEISPISDVRGASEFRKELARRILLKFFHETSDRGALACRQ